MEESLRWLGKTLLQLLIWPIATSLGIAWGASGALSLIGQHFAKVHGFWSAIWAYISFPFVALEAGVAAFTKTVIALVIAYGLVWVGGKLYWRGRDKRKREIFEPLPPLPPRPPRSRPQGRPPRRVRGSSTRGVRSTPPRRAIDPSRRRRSEYDDDYEYDERPPRRRPRDDYDDMPTRRHPRDDYDDMPTRRRPRGYDELPARRRPRDNHEDRPFDDDHDDHIDEADDTVVYDVDDDTGDLRRRRPDPPPNVIEIEEIHYEGMTDRQRKRVREETLRRARAELRRQRRERDSDDDDDHDW